MGEKNSVRPRKVPLRQCTGCGERKEKKELVRIIKTPEDQIMIDLRYVWMQPAKKTDVVHIYVILRNVFARRADGNHWNAP